MIDRGDSNIEITQVIFSLKRRIKVQFLLLDVENKIVANECEGQ